MIHLLRNFIAIHFKTILLVVIIKILTLPSFTLNLYIYLKSSEFSFRILEVDT